MSYKEHDPLPEKTPFCIFVIDDHLLVPTCTYRAGERARETQCSVMAQSETKLGFHEMDLDNRLLKVCVCDERGQGLKL